jgi:hypothetical protein
VHLHKRTLHSSRRNNSTELRREVCSDNFNIKDSFLIISFGFDWPDSLASKFVPKPNSYANCGTPAGSYGMAEDVDNARNILTISCMLRADVRGSWR